MRKPKIGDVFAIETRCGTGYLHFVFLHADLGELVRVLQGLHNTEPDVLALAERREQFLVFFPVSAAVRRKIVRYVGHAPVTFTMPAQMRTEHFEGEEFKGWHIVDTSSWKNTLVRRLSQKEKQLSPWGSWNDTLLRERLEQGWTLDGWV